MSSCASFLAISGLILAILGLIWAILGLILAIWGLIWGILGLILAILGLILAIFGLILAFGSPGQGPFLVLPPVGVSGPSSSRRLGSCLLVPSASWGQACWRLFSGSGGYFWPSCPDKAYSAKIVIP